MTTLSPSISDLWKNDRALKIRKVGLHRAVRALDGGDLAIEALALIRAAYNCSLDDAKLLLALIWAESKR